MQRRYKVFLAVAGIIFALDQATKYAARAALAKYGHEGYPIVEGWFHMRLSFNTGSAFGFLSGIGSARVILSVVGLLACVAIVMILRKTEDWQKWTTLALGLVGGGAVGNIFDRILAGKVTDFIVWKYETHEWPAFNIADAALVAGVVILFLDIGREQKKKKKAG